MMMSTNRSPSQSLLGANNQSTSPAPSNMVGPSPQPRPSLSPPPAPPQGALPDPSVGNPSIGPLTTQVGPVDDNKKYNVFAVNTNAANNPFLAGDISAINNQISDVRGQTAARAAAPMSITASQSAGVTADQTGFNAQKQALDLARQQSLGQGPAAQAIQMQTQNATNQGINAQLALAGSMRGGNYGEALRQASVGQAQVTGQAANQAAQNALASQQAGQQNLGNISGAMQGESLQQAGLTQANNQWNAGATNDINKQTQQLGTNVDLANAGFEQNMQQFKDDLINKYLSEGFTLESAQAAATQQMAEFSTNSMATQTAGAASNGVANTNATTAQITGVGGLVNDSVKTLEGVGGSDKRIKKDVEEGDSEASDFLNHLSAKEWDYKDPDKHGHGRYLGVMAQDLQKSKLGSEMVFPDKDGTLMVNYGGFGGMSAIVASLAHLNKKIQELEAIKSRKS